MLHGRESGIIKRLPHGEFIEVHEPLSQEQLHTLTAHEQYKPAEIGPTVDENGVERKVKGSEKLRAKLSDAYYGEECPDPEAHRRGVPGDHERPRPPLIAAFATRTEKGPVRSSDGALRRARGLDRVDPVETRVPLYGTPDPGAAHERCDPRWRRHRGGPLLARCC